MSRCPFLSGALENNDPPIREVIRKILIEECNLFDIDIDPYIKIFEDNLIMNSSLLFRIKPELIGKLKLPLLLENEIVKLIETHTSKRQNLECSKSSDSSRNDSRRSLSVSHSTRQLQSNEVLEKQKMVLLGITPDEREKLLNCWNHLLSLKDGSLGRFFEEFYSLFLEKDKIGRQLFENRSMKSQAQSLMKIMKFIMSSVNEPLSLIEPLRKLGLSHLIYRVKKENYTHFSIALAKTFENVLGPEIVTVDVKEAWYSMATRLGEVMMAEYEDCRRGWKSSIYFKKGKGNFKLRGTILTHEKLIILKSPDSTKVIDELLINTIEDIDIIDEGNELDVDKPSNFCFSMNTGIYTYYLCTKTDEDFDHWIDELTVRIRAHQRVGIIAVDSSDSDEDSVSMNEKSSKKRKGKKKVNKMKNDISNKSNRNKN